MSLFEIILVLLILLILFGSGYGWRSGYISNNPLGIVIIVLLVLVLLGVLGHGRIY